LGYALVEGLNVRDSRLDNYPRRWNAAPSQELLVIRQKSEDGRAVAPTRAASRSDYSITSSAPASSVGGTSRPRALAAVKFTTRSNLVEAGLTGGHLWRAVGHSKPAAVLGVRSREPSVTYMTPRVFMPQTSS
jgi:hypothetical protein